MTAVDVVAQVFQSIGHRPVQEDAFVCLPVRDGYLAAVFDGHWPGSDSLVRALARELPDAFEREYVSRQPRGAVDVERRVLRAAIRRLIKRHADASVGSTATVAWIRPLGLHAVRVHVGVLGDSPAAVWDGKRLHVPPSHTPAYLPDVQRLRKFVLSCLEGDHAGLRACYGRAEVGGGYVWTARYGSDPVGLAVTRSIGDEAFGELLVRRPAMYTWEIPVDTGCVVLATDGILTGDALPAGVRKQMAWVMEKLMREQWPLQRIGRSLTAGSGDNRTLVALTFVR